MDFSEAVVVVGVGVPGVETLGCVEPEEGGVLPEEHFLAVGEPAVGAGVPDGVVSLVVVEHPERQAVDGVGRVGGVVQDEIEVVSGVVAPSSRSCACRLSRHAAA